MFASPQISSSAIGQAAHDSADLAAVRLGTIVAFRSAAMHPPHAAMKCAECGEYVEPMSGSTVVVAWYSCPTCDHFWSATLHDGAPVAVELQED